MRKHQRQRPGTGKLGPSTACLYALGGQRAYYMLAQAKPLHTVRMRHRGGKPILGPLRPSMRHAYFTKGVCHGKANV